MPTHLPPLPRLFAGGALVVLMAACDTAGTTPFAPTAFGDSAAIGRSLSVSATGIPMLAGTQATVTILSTDCASQTSAVDVSGLVNQTLWSDGCHSSGSRTIGPVDTSGEIFFSIRGIPAQVSGDYPEFRVAMEDAGDNDYNDVVCSVSIFCSYVPPGETDPFLSDPVLQRALEQLWRSSNGDDPVSANRFERGGFYYDRGGVTEFLPYDDGGRALSACRAHRDPQQDDRLEESGADILANVHTHVFQEGTYPNPGTCVWQDGPTIEILESGPSRADRRLLADSGDPNRVAIVLGPAAIYILSADGLIREIPRFDICR